MPIRGLGKNDGASPGAKVAGGCGAQPCNVSRNPLTGKGQYVARLRATKRGQGKVPPILDPAEQV
jgi:hypothetical protein